MAKKFRLIDVLLSVVVSVLVCEAVAPAAAIGNPQFFWWAVLIIAFLLPYGMITAELATAYEDEGGIYDWVRRGLGDTWGSRVGWYYWINYPMWVVSLAILTSDTIALLFGVDFSTPVAIIIQLIFIWGVAAISFSKVSDATWLLNLTALIKVLIVIAVGVLGISYALGNGFANDMSPQTFLPSFDANGLTYLSVIIFNFMGFEVIATFTDSMQQPSKQIPVAIIAGGVVVAALYIFGSFGIGAAVPIDQISLDSGLLDALAAIMDTSSLLYFVIGVAFLMTFIGTMVCWSYGCNFIADYAAKKGNLPRFLSGETVGGAPKNATIASAALSTIFVLIAPLMEMFGMSDLFWIFFSLNIVFLIISYVPMFPAFLKLRAVDADRKRPFKVPGSGMALKIIAYLPAVLILLSIVATIVPLNGSAEEMAKLPSLVCTILVLMIGEALRIYCKRNVSEPYLGTECSGDAEAWDIAHGLK